MENNKKQPKLGPKGKRVAISISTIAVVGTLIYFEQIAVLFVLSTVALIALLLAVAFADLESYGVNKDAELPPDKFPR